MIKVDDRIGSKEFVRLLRRAGAKVTLRRLKFADFSFWGNGPTGRVRVGIERKTISEITGAIGDNRFTGHQLPGLLKRYDYVFVVIEGDPYIDAKTGLLGGGGIAFGPRRAHLYNTVMKFRLTLMLKGSIRDIPTKNKTETTFFIRALYDWFSEPWSKHKSVYQVEETRPDRALLDRRTMKRKVANQLTGLAWTRTLKADAYFPSIVAMVTGDPDFEPGRYQLETARAHWQSALGFKRGTATAKRIVDVCHRRDDVNAKGR